MTPARSQIVRVSVDDVWTEATLTKAIQKTWSLDQRGLPRFIVAVQVNNGAGFRYNRTLDAVVFDTWPSSGLYLHGLEIKCSKGDFRRELQDTAKFAEVADHLDLFSIVAPPHVADVEAMPAKWGLYSPTKSGTLKARRKPMMLHDEGKRNSVDRSFAAAFARALVTRSLSDGGHQEAYEKGKAEATKALDYELKLAQGEAEKAKTMVQEFETASGIALSGWRAGKMGEAVNFVMAGKLDLRFGYTNDLHELGEKLIALGDELDLLAGKMRLKSGGIDP
jgi:hypothetical protein